MKVPVSRRVSDQGQLKSEKEQIADPGRRNRAGRAAPDDQPAELRDLRNECRQESREDDLRGYTNGSDDIRCSLSREEIDR